MRGIASIASTVLRLGAAWLAAAGTGLPAAATPPDVPSQPASATCTPYFPYQEGWLGGDAAYSVPLNDGRRLWLFGDSFVARPGVTTRRAAALIGNTIAISTCDKGSWSLDYHWRRGGDGPAPFFAPPEAATPGRDLRYWPLAGFMHDGRLYVFLSRVTTRDADDALGFRIEGVDLARIEGLDLMPAEWRVTYRPVLRDVAALPGAAVVKQDGHALLYTPLTGRDIAGRPVALTRIALDALDAPAAGLEYLDTDERWVPGLDPARAKHVLARGATEMSVHYDSGTSLWMAVLNEAAFPSDHVTMSTAPSPEGPWSEPVFVYVIRERTELTDDKLRGRIFCYAAKAYAPLTRADRLLLTYVCNSTDPDLLLDDLQIYRPRTVLVPLPGVD